MSKLIITIILTLLLALNCSQKGNNSKSEIINGRNLQSLVKGALSGNEASNFKLSGFLVSFTPPNEKYNQLLIDSTYTSSGVKLFSVLVEFPNPLFNILAVYDENLNLYLQDNSLSGNIAAKWETISGKLFLASSEYFIAKDKIELSRLSLYSFEDSVLSLVFRSFTKFKNARKNSEQIVNYVGNDNIKTRIISNHNRKLNKKTVTFNYSSTENKYVSKNDIFHNFIVDEIKNAKWTTKKEELNIETVEKIKAELKKVNQQADKNLKEGIRGFKISLDPDWYDPINISVSEHLLQTLEGTRYLNNKLGAQITIIKLPNGSDATQFVKYKFGDVTEGAYSVRSSELITSDTNIVQIHEHSCSNKSYILVLQVPKQTYEKNKNIYSDIITTFSIDC